MNVAEMNLPRHVRTLPLLEVQRAYRNAARHAATLQTVQQAEETAAILRATRFERAARIAELAGARTALLRREVATLLAIATEHDQVAYRTASPFGAVERVMPSLHIAEEYLDAADRYTALGRDRSAGRLRLTVQDLLDAAPSLIAG